MSVVPLSRSRIRWAIATVIGVVIFAALTLVVVRTRDHGGRATSTTPTTASAVVTPEDAIAVYFRTVGVPYVGDCTDASLTRDVGSNCSLLHDDHGTTRVYATGPVFSEYETWLLLSQQTDGWHVLDAASAGSLDAPTPPPW